MKAEKLIEKVKGVRMPTGYEMKVGEMRAIRAAASDDFELTVYAFNYGFLKGQRCAKAEAKQDWIDSIRRDPSGWYSYLVRWLDRNVDNEQLLQKIGTWAQTLEELMEEKKAVPHDEG